MGTPLFINSVDGTENSKSHDFTIRFNPELNLDKNKRYYVSLDSINMAYSWYNVSSSYNNNTLKYSHDSGRTWTLLELPNGNFAYKELNAYLQRALESNGHSKTGIEIIFVPSLLRVLMTLESTFQVDLRTGDFADLIGFPKNAVVTASGYGANVPNITRSVDNIFIHTNIISESSVSGILSDVLYRFSVDNLPLSFPFHIQPRRSLFNKIKSDSIKDLRIYITDENNRPLDLNNIPISLILLIKEEKI